MTKPTTAECIADLTRVIAAGEALDDGHPLNSATTELFKVIRDQLLAAQKMAKALKYYERKCEPLDNKATHLYAEEALSAWREAGGQ